MESMRVDNQLFGTQNSTIINSFTLFNSLVSPVGLRNFNAAAFASFKKIYSAFF